MANYKKTKELSSEDAAYIAGLIDGEGTVTLSRRHANENRQVVVSIANTERALLEFVLDATGVGKITRKRVTSAKHTPSFAYSVSNQQALELLRSISPYLRSYKSARATMVLDEYEKLTPRNGKYTAAIKILRASFEAEFLALCARKTPSGSRPHRQIVPINAAWLKRMQELVKDVKVDLNERLEPDDD